MWKQSNGLHCKVDSKRGKRDCGKKWNYSFRGKLQGEVAEIPTTFMLMLQPSAASEQKYPKQRFIPPVTFSEYDGRRMCEHQENSRTWIIKLCADQLVPVLTMIFNLLLAQSVIAVIPICFKRSIITPRRPRK